MSGQPVLVHGTAIVTGTTGFLFIGPSGTGKTKLALGCINDARRSGHFAALVADDQVLVTQAQGQLIARCPNTIKGLAEIRGSAIVGIETVSACRLDFAVQAADRSPEQRLPPALEYYTLAQDAILPLLRLPIDCIDPWVNLRRILAAYLAEKQA